jgi:hypothetical protein
MSLFIATILLATSQPGIGELHRVGLDSGQECVSVVSPPSKTMNGKKILDARCDQFHPFMICTTRQSLDCVTRDVAKGGEHSVIVRYHPLPKPTADFALDWVADSPTPK